MFQNLEENTISIGYEMVDLGNCSTKIVSLGGNSQEILCSKKNHEENLMSISYEMVDLGNGLTKIA
jgi:hypothetical protein